MKTYKQEGKCVNCKDLFSITFTITDDYFVGENLYPVLVCKKCETIQYFIADFPKAELIGKPEKIILAPKGKSKLKRIIDVLRGE